MGRAEEILDISQELIQTRGYNAFSFQDLSARLGIKKASVQFYFPKKVDLGIAVVRRYRAMFAELQRNLAQRTGLTAWERLEVYLQPFLQVSGTRNMVCLCGVLGGEFLSLPKPVQEEVLGFFKLHEGWLADLLDRGRAQGAFAFEGDPGAQAKMMFSALQGALLIARGQENSHHFQTVVTVLKNMLRPHQPTS